MDIIGQMTIVFIVILYAVLCTAVASGAESRGHSLWGFFLISFFFSPILGFLILLALGVNKEKLNIRNGITKKCPYCANMIKREAIVCQYCHKDLPKKEKITKQKLSIVERNGKWGFLDENANIVIPFIYDGVTDFLDGLAHVKLNDKYGFIDKTGKEIISIKYDYAENFKDGLAKVKLNDEEFYINKEGERVEKN